MTMITVEGRYKDGKIDLAETPAGVSEAKVLITFLPTEAVPKEPRYITFGQLRVEGRPMSTEEDFKIAQWRPTQEKLAIQLQS
jgi:hypothetical protein